MGGTKPTRTTGSSRRSGRTDGSWTPWVIRVRCPRPARRSMWSNPPQVMSAVRVRAFTGDRCGLAPYAGRDCRWRWAPSQRASSARPSSSPAGRHSRNRAGLWSTAGLSRSLTFIIGTDAKNRWQHAAEAIALIKPTGVTLLVDGEPHEPPPVADLVPADVASGTPPLLGRISTPTSWPPK
jgi:hypothetical protein